MVGTQLVAGACNKEHRSKVLAESATLKSLEEKLERLSTLEKSESSSATLSVQRLRGLSHYRSQRIVGNAKRSTRNAGNVACDILVSWYVTIVLRRDM